MPDRKEVVIQDLKLVYEYIRKEVHDIASRKCRMMDKVNDAIALLKEQEAVVRCKDCENWIPGYITDHDDFIPPKCGKYQQMVGHSAADYCSLAERK